MFYSARKRRLPCCPTRLIRVAILLGSRNTLSLSPTSGIRLLDLRMASCPGVGGITQFLIIAYFLKGVQGDLYCPFSFVINTCVDRGPKADLCCNQRSPQNGALTTNKEKQMGRPLNKRYSPNIPQQVVYKKLKLTSPMEQQ